MYISCEKLYLILLRQLEPVGKKKNRRNVSVKVLERGWLCAVGFQSSKSLVPVPILVFPKSGIRGPGIPVPVTGLFLILFQFQF